MQSDLFKIKEIYERAVDLPVNEKEVKPHFLLNI